MNVFVIPSWYPSEKKPINGIFVKEQLKSLKKIFPEISIAVSRWGQGDNGMPVRPSVQMFCALKWRLTNSKKIYFTEEGLEIFNPKLEWSKYYPWGGCEKLFAINQENFEVAESVLGKIDIIHAHVSYPAGFIAAFLSKKYGIPYVLTEHMSPFPFSSLMKNGKPIIEIFQAINEAAETVAVSPSLADRIEKITNKKSIVIPNVVDGDRFNLGSPKSKKTVFFTLCAISEQKGIDHLLEAIALWNPPADKFEFLIGGDGPQRNEYIEKANILGLSDRVKWLGAISQEDAPKLYHDCHIFVLPSRHETFGVVYAEAIASGKPIIATRCGGPEFIVNQENGKLVDVGDISALSLAMKNLASEWESFNPKVIREDFEKRFSQNAVANQLYMLYQKILNKE